MSIVLRLAPKNVAASDVALGQVWIEFERAPAVELRLLRQNSPPVVDLILIHQHSSESRMRQCEIRIALDCTREVLDGAVHSFDVIGKTEAETLQIFVISTAVVAVAVARTKFSSLQPRFEGTGNSSAD